MAAPVFQFAPVPEAAPPPDGLETTIVLEPEAPVDFDLSVAGTRAAAEPEFSPLDIKQVETSPQAAMQAQAVEELAPEVPLEETIVLEPLPEIALAPAATPIESSTFSAASPEPLGELIVQEITPIEPALEPVQSQPETAQLSYAGIGTELEFTAAPAVYAGATELIAELEPTILPAQEVPEVTPDPALVTDMQQIATDFVTTFGQAEPETVPLGVMSESPAVLDELVIEPVEAAQEIVLDEITTEAPAALGEVVVEPAEIVSSAIVLEPVADSEPEVLPEAAAPVAEIPTVETAAAPIELEPVAEAAASVIEPVPSPLPPVSESAGVDVELAKALEEAITNREPATAHVPEIAALAQPATVMIDKSVVEELVGRVLARLKPELIAEITRELEAERKG